jgi:hypothetical protein
MTRTGDARSSNEGARRRNEAKRVLGTAADRIGTPPLLAA